MALLNKEALLAEAMEIVRDDAFGGPRILQLIKNAPEVHPLEEFEGLVKRQDMPITIPAILETKAYKELKRKYGG